MKQIKNLALASVLCAGSYVAGMAQQVAPAIPADTGYSGRSGYRTEYPELVEENDTGGENRSDV